MSWLFFFFFNLAAPDLSSGSGLLSCSMHVGSSSPTRDRTRAPCIGSMVSYPLDHQGSPLAIVNSVAMSIGVDIHGTFKP